MFFFYKCTDDVLFSRLDINRVSHVKVLRSYLSVPTNATHRTNSTFMLVVTILLHVFVLSANFYCNCQPAINSSASHQSSSRSFRPNHRSIVQFEQTHMLLVAFSLVQLSTLFLCSFLTLIYAAARIDKTRHEPFEFRVTRSLHTPSNTYLCFKQSCIFRICSSRWEKISSFDCKFESQFLIKESVIHSGFGVFFFLSGTIFQLGQSLLLNQLRVLLQLFVEFWHDDALYASKYLIKKS